MAKKREKKLSKKDYEAFLQKIKAKLIQLREENSENLESSLQDLQSTEAHHLADAEELSADSTDDLLVSQLVEMGASKIQEIDKALDKIEKKTYGYCEECGEFIGMERIKALPFTSLCINCKRSQEKRVGGNPYSY
ncbi:MAG: TraR/DksA family transcriptional regulator [Planctomycetota bacterium]|nr:MAG: TraR/DksA family transcriptional regulator [Planctomycetota bacterium]